MWTLSGLTLNVKSANSQAPVRHHRAVDHARACTRIGSQTHAHWSQAAIHSSIGLPQCLIPVCAVVYSSHHLSHRTGEPPQCRAVGLWQHWCCAHTGYKHQNPHVVQIWEIWCWFFSISEVDMLVLLSCDVEMWGKNCGLWLSNTTLSIIPHL